MSDNNVISITDMTQKAYNRIAQEGLAQKTLQQYWYCGVVPIRRYYEQRGIEVYSSRSMNDCVLWFQEQYRQGATYPYTGLRGIDVLRACLITLYITNNVL